MENSKPARKYVTVSAVVIAACVAAVAKFEGYRAMPYRDTGGVWTVCAGHTGNDVKPGERWTPEQCEAAMSADIREAATAVLQCAPGPLTIGQQVAFADFHYNTGAYCRSSAAKITDVRQSCAVILKYVYVAGKNCNDPASNCTGIIKRRQWEYQTCVS